MIRERDYEVPLPAIPVPATRVYAYTTRLADFDSPAIERILRPATELAAHTVRIELRTGDSTTHAESRPPPASAFARAKYEVKRRLHRRLPVVERGERTALDMRFSFMGNYAHLVHDVIAPLRFIERTLEGDPEVRTGPIHVILGRTPPAIATRVLDHAGIPYLCTDGVVRGRLVSISQDLNVCLLPDLARQPFESGSGATPERVFVSRRGARSLLNEAAVTDLLAREGFTRVYMEDHPIGHQWALLANAREVVGIHGAGLSSLGFSIHRASPDAPRFRLVELFSAGFSSSCFRDYAAVLGGTWVGVRGRVTPEIVRDLDVLGHARAHDNASFEVDLEALAEALAFSRSGGGHPGAGD